MADETKKERCPSCGSPNVLPIVYGEPGSVEIFKARERGELVIGGCLIDEENPTRECADCKHQFGRLADEQPEWFKPMGGEDDK